MVESDLGGPSRRTIVASTPRVVLTTWLPEDVDALLDVHFDPESMRYVRFGRPETRSEVEALVESYISDHARRGWTKWRVADRHGALVGRAGFGGDDDLRGIAFAVRRSHWGHGLATEISRALVDWHVTHAPSTPLRGLVEVGNDASARVLQKTGFVEVGEEDYQGAACRVFLHPNTGIAPASALLGD